MTPPPAARHPGIETRNEDPTAVRSTTDHRRTSTTDRRRTSATDRLLVALAAARDAFEAHDAITASGALDAVVTACAELEGAGARLHAETLEHARALHRACAVAALEAQGALNEKLEQAGDARRAVRSYGG